MVQIEGIIIRNHCMILCQKVGISITKERVVRAFHYRSQGESPERIVVLCHGFGGDKNEWGRFPLVARDMVDGAAVDVLAFDFTGSGENQRIPITLSAQVEDLEAIDAWSQQQGYKALATIGLSLGGLIALLARMPSRRVAIYWNPGFFIKEVIGKWKIRFARFVSRFKQVVRTDKQGAPLFLARNFFSELLGLDVKAALTSVDVPTLIVQGLVDSRVLPRHSRQAVNLLPKDIPHELHEVPGAPHGFDGAHLEEFTQVSIKWIQEYLPAVDAGFQQSSGEA